MAGMSRDKIGASNVAGFMKVVSMLKPSKVNCILPILVSCTDHFWKCIVLFKVKVVGAMCMVRNSCGSNAYVSDEIIASR